MRWVRKKQGKIIQAYRLGDDHPVLRQLMEDGKIVCINDKQYEVFSQEAVFGKGQLTSAGDYVKIDYSGYPYPNRADFFHENHRHLAGDDYEQIPKPLLAWCAEDEMCEEIAYLQKEKGLVIDKDNPEKMFRAPLWGCMEAAAADAQILFYEIKRDEAGTIIDIDFNFIAKKEFEEDYIKM